MAMELITPQNNMDNFDFHSARTSPHVSPPMTPRRFGESYFSAPTSPSRATELYEEISKMGMHEDSTEFDFQFCNDVQMGSTLSCADDLFDGGKFRPLKSQIKSEIVSGDFKAGAFHQSSTEKMKYSNISDHRRGRTVDSPLSSPSSRGATRSPSPLKIGAILEEQGDERPNDIAKMPISNPSSSVFRKWKLKDFLLFRSASEGHASDKYPMKKFAALRKDQVDGKSRSFRSVDSFGPETGMRKKTQMSAHEMHYTKNKAASESLKKKTYLPYRQGIFGRLF